VAERLRCNICNCEIDLAKAQGHAETKQHAKLKSKLEQDLSATKEKVYAHDVSVVLRWSESAD